MSILEINDKVMWNGEECIVHKKRMILPVPLLLPETLWYEYDLISIPMFPMRYDGVTLELGCPMPPNPQEAEAVIQQYEQIAQRNEELVKLNNEWGDVQNRKKRRLPE